jgi:hypothetical protein
MDAIYVFDRSPALAYNAIALLTGYPRLNDAEFTNYAGDPWR